MFHLFAQREAMSKVDTAWLRMDRPTNLMTITGVIGLAEALELDALKACLQQRFLSFRRFRQRAVDDGHQAWWEEDPDFDLDWHVRRVGLPHPGGRAELEELVGQLASTPLDPSKPRWQFHLIDDYEGGSALICRVHHCYADGMAMVQVMLSMTDAHPAPKSRAGDPGNTRQGPLAIWERWLAPAREGMEHVSSATEQLVRLLGEWAMHPAQAMQRLSQMALHGAEESGGMLRELLHSLTLPDDPPTPLKQPLGVSKQAAWCDPLPLDEIKALGKVLGCTVNDLLLAAACGALREHLLSLGEVAEDLSIRATVPVNLRGPDRLCELGNHFGLVFLDLPVGEANPIARLQRVSAAMRELKGSRQAAVSYGLLNALGSGPVALQGPALEQLSRKATAVATNVPGPPQPLYLAGVCIDSLMFWVPQSGTIGVGISILSYAGKVWFGLIADRHCLPQPRAVVEAFSRQFEQMMLLALMNDDGESLDPERARALTGAQHSKRPKKRSSRGARG